ncbi:chitobiase/beta-hexosaminidase C-terminal domain-containing protein [Chitinophaga caseinilytica]|uniref:chitobiase/beta-hexosaminidase C-terminal domain-containing protein n=1 Tax=Chitinophaga caseinilytica TaxID=2267521 RepID=UPI003C2EF736
MNQHSTKWQSIGGSLLLASNIFVLVLLLAGDRLAVPSWLQVAGRMHPLVLHFPIVLLLIGAVLPFVPMRNPEAVAWRNQVTAVMLLLGALSAAVTVMMGLFLSREEGYSAEGPLFWHKWGGALLLWTASALYWLRNSLKGWGNRGFSLGMIVLLMVTGHFGAVVTHGENFVLAPVTPAFVRPVVPIDQAELFAHVVQPILEEKCMSCHNPGKAKGGLSMKDSVQMLAGGKTGELFISGDPAASLLMLRLHLPDADKKHMPPAGKPQLTEAEIAILHHWIQNGAKFDGKVKSLPPQDTLYQLAAARLTPTGGAEQLDLPHADEKLVAKLNNNYRVVYPVALYAAPLVANWYNRDKFDIGSVKELLPLKDQLTEMHLQKMPVKDEDLALLAQFRELRVLNLGFTQITGKTLGELAKLPHLQRLSVAGTPVAAQQLLALKKAPKLDKIYTWNTGISSTDMQKIQSTFPGVELVNGFISDGQEQLKLNQPEIVNTAAIFKNDMQLIMKHRVKGVEIRYTTDGSAPDSVNSPVFKDSLRLTESTVIRAIACKKGWNVSDPVQYSFSKSTYRPDSITLISQPEGQYTGNGAKTLNDAEKGTFNYSDGKWLGYVNHPLEAVVRFEKAVPLKQVSFSTFRHQDAYIFPPEQIEVWGGKDKNNLRLLRKTSLPPAKQGDPVAPITYNCDFPEAEVSYVKIVMRPLGKIPVWHPGKGGHGWAFIDELMFN